MIGRKRSKIGDEEEIEEELHAVGFVPLGEDKTAMIGTRQR